MNSTVPRVKSGLPWWVIACLILGILVVAAQFLVSGQKRSPQEAFELLRNGLESGSDKIRQMGGSYKILQETPGYEAELKYIDAMIAIRRNREPKAVRLLKEVVETPHLKVGAYRQIGECYARMSEYQKSIENIKKSIELAEDQDSIASRMLLARTYGVLGNQRLALQALQGVLEIVPDHAEASELMGDAYFAVGEYDSAIEIFSQLYTTPGEYSAADPARLERYVAALIRSDSDKLSEVYDECIDLLNDAGTHVEALLHSGSDDDRRKYSESEPDIRRPDIDKKFVTARVTLDAGNAALALSQLREVAEKRSRSRYALELARDIFKELGQDDQAALAQQNIDGLDELPKRTRTLIEAIGDDLTDPNSRLEVAYSLLDQGRFSEARNWFSCYDRVGRDQGLPKGEDLALQRYQTTSPLVPIPGFLEKTPLNATAEAGKTQGNQTAAQQDTKSDAENSEQPKDDQDSTDDSSAAEAESDGKSDVEKDSADKSNKGDEKPSDEQ